MFSKGERVLVGVSGGPDSVALLHVLHDLAPHLSLTLGVAHLNHGLRPESAEEALFVKALSETMGLTLHTGQADVNAYRRMHRLSLEEAAREVRYAFYKKVQTDAGYQKIALGHHSDDNAEMVLMNLLRGTGPLGLAGIPPVRDGWIVRPLINLPRRHIRAYLDRRQLDCISDPSNRDTRFTRNRIRHELLPLLEKDYNANIAEALHRTARIIRDENRWMESLVDSLCAAAISKGPAGRLVLTVDSLAHLPRAPLRRIIRRAVQKLRGSLRRITFAHVDAILDLIQTESENARVDLPGLVSAVREKNRLVLAIMDGPRQPLDPAGPPPYRYLVDRQAVSSEQPFTLALPEIGARIILSCRETFSFPLAGGSGQQVVFFDINRLKFPLVIRNYQPGDRFTPSGMPGSKKVKKLFSEHKVPPAERGGWPVLVSGNDIIWAAGLQRARAAMVTAQTRFVLEIKIVLPDGK